MLDLPRKDVRFATSYDIDGKFHGENKEVKYELVAELTTLSFTCAATKGKDASTKQISSFQLETANGGLLGCFLLRMTRDFCQKSSANDRTPKLSKLDSI